LRLFLATRPSHAMHLFFFSSRRRHTRFSRDWSSDVCSSDLNYMQTVLGINIIGRYNDDRTGIGLDPNAPITLSVTDKPALTVLRSEERRVGKSVDGGGRTIITKENNAHT